MDHPSLYEFMEDRRIVFREVGITMNFQNVKKEMWRYIISYKFNSYCLSVCKNTLAINTLCPLQYVAVYQQKTLGARGTAQ